MTIASLSHIAPRTEDPVFPILRIVVQGAAALLLVTLVAGCAMRRAAPVEERDLRARPPVLAPAPSTEPGVSSSTDNASRPEPTVATYTVKRGDTLYQIALDNGLDYRELAAWNSIENANRIFVGQVLRLGAPGDTTTASAAPDGVTTAPLRSAPPPVAETRTPATVGAVPAASSAASPAAGGNLKTSPKAIKEPYSDQAVRELTLAATAVPAPPGEAARPATAAPPRVEAPRASAGEGDDDDRLDWAWPAKGKIVGGFSDTANLKGIDIAGSAGDPVVATAPGKVVYAGSGLRGYGKLIIIKHNKTYLSAYAHNRDILVKEGQQVARGQKIAEMGNSDADAVKLHFEIRRLGKPMDPARYLPPA
jgi:lipoprotein NlpD